MDFSEKHLNEKEVALAERDAARGAIDLGKLTSEQRNQYEETKKKERHTYAFKNGLNLYNFFCPTGKVQVSYPPYREQRVMKGPKKEVVIRHFN